MNRPRRLKGPSGDSAITAAVLADRRWRRAKSARERRPTRAAKGAGRPRSAAVADTRSLLDEAAELETAHEAGTAMRETLERIRTRTELIERQNRLVLALLRARRLRELLEGRRTAIPDPTSEQGLEALLLRLVEIAYEACDVEDYRTALSTYKALAILAGHIPEADWGSFTSAEEERRVCTRLGVTRQDLRGQR